MQSWTPPVCSFGTRHYPSQRCADTRGVRPSDAVGSETRSDQPRHHSAESSAGRPSMGPGSDLGVLPRSAPSVAIR